MSCADMLSICYDFRHTRKLKIIDYGLAVEHKGHEECSSHGKTTVYASKEVMSKSVHT